MNRILVRVTADNKAEAIAALETTLEIVKKREYPGKVLAELEVENEGDISHE